jgi:hypothetical protein
MVVVVTAAAVAVVIESVESLDKYDSITSEVIVR